MKTRPRIIKHEPTTIQELVGALMIVGATFFVSLSGVFGIIGLVGKGLKRLVK